MAYRVTQRIISSDDLLYPYFDDLCRKSKLLYNAALFRVRNIFTGYDKEHRTENEVEVFQEVALLQQSYPNMHVRRVISYTHLEKMMRVTENADFFPDFQDRQHSRWSNSQSQISKTGLLL